MRSAGMRRWNMQFAASEWKQQLHQSVSKCSGASGQHVELKSDVFAVLHIAALPASMVDRATSASTANAGIVTIGHPIFPGWGTTHSSATTRSSPAYFLQITFRTRRAFGKTPGSE